MSFSARTRQETIDKFQRIKLDVLVIGGGITGAGLVLQGSAQGMNIGLIEKKDFSSGTSSRSTKLVHGGLRYLKQFDVEVVADITKERSIIGGMAPHTVQPEFMVTPVYDEPGATFSDFSSEIALKLYDYLADVDEYWKHYFVTDEQLLDAEPDLKSEGLIKGGVYLDYLNDDSRLTVDTIKKAHDFGGLISNYVEMVDFIYENSEIIGVHAKDMLSGEEFDIYASVIVNATGPWSDEIRSHLNQQVNERMYPTKGVHFVVDHERLPVKGTIYTDTGLNDGRMIFIIPRGNKTYFGTTDTPVDNISENEVSQEDIDYLLKAMNFRFPDAKLSVEDIKASWSGLRPLLNDSDEVDPGSVSRSHEIIKSKPNVITIAGGKLTDFRLMAMDVFDEIKPLFTGNSENFTEVDTSTIQISGGELAEEKNESFSDYVKDKIQEGVELGLSEEEAKYLADWYGTNIPTVYGLIDQAKDSSLPLYIALQAEYAIEYEMAQMLEDFFDRRTEHLLFHPEDIDNWKHGVSEIFARKLNWTDEMKSRNIDQLEKLYDKTTLKSFK